MILIDYFFLTGILESVKQELEIQQGQNVELDQRIIHLREKLREKEEKILSLQFQIEELITAKVSLKNKY